MAYYVGDIPAEDLVIEPARNEEPVDLEIFESATAVLRDSQGVEVASAGFLATIGEESVIVEWPDADLFTSPGLYSLTVVLETVDGKRERVAPTYVVVQDDDGWQSLDSAREDWPDARKLSDRKLFLLLELAKQEVLAYLDEEGELAPIRPPIHYGEGQAMQARNLWNAAKVDPANGGIGEESFVVRPFPLDWMVRQVLKPKRGVPVIG